MNPWMRDPGSDVSGTAQFEGRTAEEAVARARAALGDSGALRCWKTRRGGVGGFFAKEVFVAGLTPPPGSETTRSKASRPEPDVRREAGPDRDPVSGAAPYDGTTRAAGSPPGHKGNRWPGGPPLGVGRSHVRSGVLAVAGDPGRGVRRGARRGAGGVDTRARGQWRHHSTRPRGSAPADLRHGGAGASPSQSPHLPDDSDAGVPPDRARARDRRQRT